MRCRLGSSRRSRDRGKAVTGRNLDEPVKRWAVANIYIQWLRLKMLKKAEDRGIPCLQALPLPVGRGDGICSGLDAAVARQQPLEPLAVPSRCVHPVTAVSCTRMTVASACACFACSFWIARAYACARVGVVGRSPAVITAHFNRLLGFLLTESRGGALSLDRFNEPTVYIPLPGAWAPCV